MKKIKKCVLVTAKKEDIDKIKGLGADDYVVKPFSPVELVARVKAHMQIHQSLKEGKKENCLQAGDLEIYPDSYKAFKKGKILDLTGKEFEILCFCPESEYCLFQRTYL